MTKRGIVVTVSGLVAFVGTILVEYHRLSGTCLIAQFIAVAVIDTTWNGDRPYED